MGDIQRGYYRSDEEEEKWKTERDPLRLLRQWLIEQEIASEGDFEQIEEDVRAEVEAGVEFALDAPYPDPSEVDLHVYA